MNDIIEKLKNGEELSEKEIKKMVYEGNFVDEIEGDDYRWQRDVQTIIDIDGQLYAVDWLMGLTECQENDFFNQPYKVKCVEKVIRTKSYEAI